MRRPWALGGLKREALTARMAEHAATKGRRERLARGALERVARDHVADIRVEGFSGARPRLGSRGELALLRQRLGGVDLALGIARARGVAEQVADRGAGVAAPAGIPAHDRIVEAQPVLLDQRERERGGRGLRDAVERERGVRRHRPSRLHDGVAGRATPHAPVGEHDRRRRPGDARVGDALPQPRAELALDGRREARTGWGRRGRAIVAAARRPAQEGEEAGQRGQAQGHAPTLRRGSCTGYGRTAVPRVRPRRCAVLAASTRLAASSLGRMFRTCMSTVRVLR